MSNINELQLAKELIRFPSVTPVDAGVMKILEKKRGKTYTILDLNEDLLTKRPFKKMFKSGEYFSVVFIFNNQYYYNIPSLPSVASYLSQFYVV